MFRLVFRSKNPFLLHMPLVEGLVIRYEKNIFLSKQIKTERSFTRSRVRHRRGKISGGISRGTSSLRRCLGRGFGYVPIFLYI